MVYSIDSVHLNNGHMYTAQFMHIFGSASCVQQLIIPEGLNQIYIVAHRWKEKILSFIYIVAHRWKEEVLSFPTMSHSNKSVTCIKFKGSSYE